jgi:hypothetical protein
MPSWQKPTDDQVGAAIAKLVQIAHIRYFFQNLKNPEWLEPLWKRGFLRNPPEPIAGDKPGTVSLPVWAESGYLARVAGEKPEVAIEIIKNLANTKNARVIEDLVDAAHSLPPAVISQLLPQIKVWSENPYQIFLAEKLGALGLRVGQGGFITESIKIAAYILKIQDTTQREATGAVDDDFAFRPTPNARIPNYEFDKVLTENVLPLAELGDVRVLSLVSDLLEQVVRLAHRISDDDDFSYIWCPSIESLDPSSGGDVEDTLVRAVRDVSLRLSLKGPESHARVIASLSKRPLGIFKRVLLFVLAQTTVEQDPYLRKFALDQKIFDDHRFSGEYSFLIEKKFLKLAEADKAQYIGWIKRGPDVEGYIEHEASRSGKPPVADDVSKYAGTWKRDRIAWFGADIPAELRDEYAGLVARYGEPESPRRKSTVVSWIGPTSPRDVTELAALSFDELSDYLKKWQPENAWEAPSREGLARNLASIIAERPVDFSASALTFIGVQSAYARALITGWSESITLGSNYDWDAIIRFCEWVVDQKDTTEVGSEDNVQPWSWTRKSIARLLELAFRDSLFPTSITERGWRIVDRLTQDDDPAKESYGSGKIDAITVAINSVRGSAYLSAFQYGLWRIRTAQGNLTLQEMPELRTVLDRGLDPRFEWRLSVHATYGQLFPWLNLIDPEWAKANVDRIFPSEADGRERWQCAWGSYLQYCPPYRDVLAVLRPKYLNGIQFVLSSEDEPEQDITSKLASHIMTYYWRGELEDPEGCKVLELFYSAREDRLAANAASFLGRSLLSLKEVIPPKILARLMHLWESRVEFYRANPKIPAQAELEEFGWWFASGHFDPLWALENLDQIISIVPKVERDRDVVQQLVKICDSAPLMVASCFEKFVKKFAPVSYVSYWREPAKELLARLVAQPDPRVKEIALRVADFLGALGYIDILDRSTGTKR